jgi:EmrB/QacA subfamily drug resistance transporter
VSDRALDANTATEGQGSARPWLILALTCAAQFMGVLDVTIVNVALPSMQQDLGLSPGALQWVVNAYTLTFAGFLLLGGRAADVFGLKRVFLTGLALFTVASLFGGLAQDGWQLVAARALQGLGGAIFTPATLTMITTTFPERRAQAKALGIWSAVAGAGGALGGVIGGLLTGILSWRWVLIVNVPLGVVLFVAAALLMPADRSSSPRGGLDLPGSITVTLGAGCLVGAIIGIEQWGWSAAPTLGLFGAALVLLVAFIAIERQAPRPLVPLSIFRVRSVAVANLLSLGNSGVIPAVFFFLSLYLQLVLGMNPLTAGLAMIPAAVGIAVGSVLASRLVVTLGSRIVVFAGSVLSAAALGWLSFITPDGPYWVQVPAPLFLSMVGMGVIGLPLTMSATSGVGRDQQGLTAGLLNSARQIGGAIGMAGFVALAAAASRALTANGAGTADAMVGGFRIAWLVGVGVLLITGVAAFALPKATRREPDRVLKELNHG